MLMQCWQIWQGVSTGATTVALVALDAAGVRQQLPFADHSDWPAMEVLDRLEMAPTGHTSAGVPSPGPSRSPHVAPVGNDCAPHSMHAAAMRVRGGHQAHARKASSCTSLTVPQQRALAAASVVPPMADTFSVLP